MQADLLRLLSAREGHFRYESGYHARLWLDLDPLFLRPRALQPFIQQLARQLAPYHLDAICGPMTGGALIAAWVAEALDLEFYSTERRVKPQQDGLYPVKYPLPASLHRFASGKRMAILDDVVSAGSAVRGSLLSLREAEANVAVVGALLVLGDTAPEYFAAQDIAVETIVRQPNPLWRPANCPLCAAGVPLEDYTPEGNG